MPPAAVAASRAEVVQAKRAARRFLAGYLPYTYGQASARQIRAVNVRLCDSGWRAIARASRPASDAADRA